MTYAAKEKKKKTEFIHGGEYVIQGKDILGVNGHNFLL